jgi:hypothetical protein
MRQAMQKVRGAIEGIDDPAPRWILDPRAGALSSPSQP